MRISAISKGLIAPVLIAGAASCNHLHNGDNAKNKAAQYLTATELVEAEKRINSESIPGYTDDYNNKIIYWDSIITENKVKEAYALGKQIGNELAEFGYSQKELPEYKNKSLVNADISTDRSGALLYNNLKDQATSYYNAQEYIKLRDNEPDFLPLNNIDNIAPNILHFWNLIVRTAKERIAFDEGMQAGKTKAKTDSLDIKE